MLDVNPKPVIHFHLKVAKAFAMPSIPVRTTLSALIHEWEGPDIQVSDEQVTLLRAKVVQRLCLAILTINFLECLGFMGTFWSLAQISSIASMWRRNI